MTSTEVGHGAARTVTETEPTRLIVGIGASAGGLEAFRAFFAQMPIDTGMAFVLVQTSTRMALSFPHARSRFAKGRKAERQRGS